MAPEQREKEDNARIIRQRPILRVCSELALVGIIKDSSERSGAEWVMKAVKDLVCFARVPVAETNSVYSYPTIPPCHLYHCSQLF